MENNKTITESAIEGIKRQCADKCVVSHEQYLEDGDVSAFQKREEKISKWVNDSIKEIHNG